MELAEALAAEPPGVLVPDFTWTAQPFEMEYAGVLWRCESNPDIPQGDPHVNLLHSSRIHPS